MSLEESKEGCTGGPQTSNIQAALASIIQQESSEEAKNQPDNQANEANGSGAHNRQTSNFELSADQEQYLEKKILEILERNRDPVP